MKTNKLWSIMMMLVTVLCTALVFSSCSKEDDSSELIDPSSPDNGPNDNLSYVDLGLEVMWAKCNVGAFKPEEIGSYFAWGEVETKNEFNSTNYKWGKIIHQSGYSDKLEMTKYNGVSAWGKVDDKYQLDNYDDVAYVKCGSKWHMPTTKDMQQLVDFCTWTWTIKNRVAGYEVKSTVNGNSIFLPAGGAYRYGSFTDVGSKGYYWSRDVVQGGGSSQLHAVTLEFSKTENKVDWDAREYGLLVRPVCSK